MSSPEPRTNDEMLSLVTRQAAYRIGRRARHRRVLKLASVVVVVSAFAGAALFIRAGSEGTSRFDTVGMPVRTSAGDGSAERLNMDSGAGGSAGTIPADTEADRAIISTGSITVRVDDVEESATEAAAIASDAGGYVSKMDSKLEGDQQITLTLRVPADQFEEAMDQAAALGEVQSRTMDSADVTDQILDLEGRLETAQTSATRLRELLVEAQDVQHVIAIEDRLAQKEVEIEQFTRELTTVEDRVDHATISVKLTEQKEAPKVNDDLPGPLEALRSGAVAFVNVALASVAAVAFALPFLMVALLAWWLIRRWRGRSV